MIYAYSLFDSKAVAFAPPFFMLTDGLAVRAVLGAAADLGTALGRHPADFTLYRVGCFDEHTGDLKREAPMINLGLVVSFLTPSSAGPTDLFNQGETANA